MRGSLKRKAIAALARRCGYVRRRRVVKFDGSFLFRRYEFMWFDEFRNERNGQSYHRPPWWRPFNAFLHCWRPTAGEEFHDHPRWSITICLAGELTEKTPWNERVLRPGSIQFRTRKFIHAFEVRPEHRGKTWTLFIVGRRNHWQNTYRITSQRPIGDRIEGQAA